jgi:hypothetical protein
MNSITGAGDETSEKRTKRRSISIQTPPRRRRESTEVIVPRRVSKGSVPSVDLIDEFVISEETRETLIETPKIHVITCSTPPESVETSDVSRYSSMYLCLIILTIFLLIWYYLSPVSTESTLLYGLSRYSLQFACLTHRDGPIGLLLSGKSTPSFDLVTSHIVSELSSCKNIRWETKFLNSSVAFWRNVVFDQLRRNPHSLFIMDTVDVDFITFEFLKDAMDGKNSIVSWNSQQVSSASAIFVFLTRLGSNKGSTDVNLTENERIWANREILKSELQENGWEDRFIHRIQTMISI